METVSNACLVGKYISIYLGVYITNSMEVQRPPGLCVMTLGKK